MRLRRLVVTSTLAAALAVGLAACGGDGGDQGGAASGGGPVVRLKDNKFSPRDLTVRVGQPVTWDWKDRFVQHNVVGADFASKTQRRGTFTHTYAKPGTYPYRCTLHADMKGTITVTATQ